MKVICFGSMIIDQVFRVPHFVKPGETVISTSSAKFPGGKGANQAVAITKAGVEVVMAGKVGRNEVWYLDKLNEFNVDTSLVRKSEFPTGSAIIQVNEEGENCIIINLGANGDIDDQQIIDVLDSCEENDIFSFKFGNSEIARSKILRFICSVLGA